MILSSKPHIFGKKLDLNSAACFLNSAVASSGRLAIMKQLHLNENIRPVINPINTAARGQ